jgi:hypothetical protein
MIVTGSRHKADSRRLLHRSIALLQLLVMLVLAVPASSYDLGRDLGSSGVSVSAELADAGHVDCPCCPGDDDSSEGKSDFDDCSTCSYCYFYTPLSSELIIRYAPSVARLTTPEEYFKPLEVHIPIDVPPQELA